VIVTDLLDAPLAIATRAGATATVRADHPDSAADPAWPDDVDVAIEASGSGTALPCGAPSASTVNSTMRSRSWPGLDVAPVISHTLPLARAVEAFALAGDRTMASKVLLDLSVE
jgi:L-idonate 5-dehydrogenase